MTMQGITSATAWMTADWTEYAVYVLILLVMFAAIIGAIRFNHDRMNIWDRFGTLVGYAVFEKAGPPMILTPHWRIYVRTPEGKYRSKTVQYSPRDAEESLRQLTGLPNGHVTTGIPDINTSGEYVLES